MIWAWIIGQRMSCRVEVESLEHAQTCLRQLGFCPDQGFIAGAIEYAKGRERTHWRLHRFHCMDLSVRSEASRGASASKPNGLPAFPGIFSG